MSAFYARATPVATLVATPKVSATLTISPTPVATPTATAMLTPEITATPVPEPQGSNNMLYVVIGLLVLAVTSGVAAYLLLLRK